MKQDRESQLHTHGNANFGVEKLNSSALGGVLRRKWSVPQASKIEIARTMSSGGSGADALGQATLT